MITIAALAKRWDVSKSTVQRLIDRRELLAKRLAPRIIRIDEAEIDRYEKAKARAACPSIPTSTDYTQSSSSSAGTAFIDAARQGRRKRKLTRSKSNSGAKFLQLVRSG